MNAKICNLILYLIFEYRFGTIIKKLYVCVFLYFNLGLLNNSTIFYAFLSSKVKYKNKSFSLNCLYKPILANVGYGQDKPVHYTDEIIFDFLFYFWTLSFSAANHQPYFFRSRHSFLHEMSDLSRGKLICTQLACLYVSFQYGLQ
ncbi:hypothetical protein BpHYR1_046837 [Brachionus plicatilis]|uniref:Uncharacterized protein n=1 Tax=Brachionus plicatilis TaxID=10195 RepID=A0A3M7S0V3_BRAPC|nr:hypothetical protein BpHYR1_046837 [Brachionus plicatilis]